MIQHRKRGYKHGSDSWGVVWVWFDHAIPDDDLEVVLDEYDLYPYQGGAGEWYAKKPLVKRSKWHTLITQVTGLDV